MNKQPNRNIDHRNNNQTAMKRISFVASLLILLTVGLPVLASAGEAEFLRLQAEVEQTILEFRDVVEAAYGNRCDNTNLEQCYQSNYHGCLSSFPSASCPAVNDFVFEVCLGGSDCSSLFDYTVSSIRYPPLTQINSDLDPDLVASTCFSQNLDEYFINQRDTDLEYWERWGVESPWMHFSSITGQFRIYPARPDDRCFTYDPRVRPFYVAGSSGPKNILLLLDTSGSMDGLRMENMKTAAERVVSTLTIGDRVALIPFSTKAEVVEVGSQKLMKANEDVKEQLIQRIRNLEAVGSTNFYDAFDKAFSIMQEAIPNELVVECNTAVLFLTDGKMTEPEDVTEAQVLQFAQDGLKEMEDNIGHPVRLFTYSISQDNDVHTFPKELACATETPGVWSKIVNAEDIVDSLSSYYKLFA